MAYGDKVAAHPEKSEITERLVAGESPDSIATWLRSKFPTNRNRWLSSLTLQRYRQNIVGLKGEVLKDIRHHAAELKAERVTEQRTYSLQNSPEYEAAKVQVVNDVLKRDQLILDLHDRIWSRIQLLENEKFNYKNEAVIVEYIGQMRQLLADFHKMTMDAHKLANKGDGTTNVQVVVQQAQEQINSLKSIIVETLQEMAPELIPSFLEKIKDRIGNDTGLSSPTTVNVQVNKHG